MDYNEIRRRRMIKEGKKVPSSKKIDKLIILAVIVLALSIICGVIIVIKMIPQKPQTENNMTDLVTQPPSVEYIVTPEPTATAMPTIEPISPMGKKEPIPSDVWESMQGRSWTENPNVGYDDLMYLTIPHYDFNYEVCEGHMIVAADVADEVLNIFAELFEIQYPIERMELVDKYFDNLTDTFDTPDRNSMGHNNTSSFYYRVVNGTSSISQHAYGRAIDLNPCVNPWVQGSSVSPRNAGKFADRSLYKSDTDFTNWTDTEKAAFIGYDTEVYEIFTKYGWEWGGSWSSYQDYQHFQKKR